MLDVLMLFPKPADPQAFEDTIPKVIAELKKSSGLRSLRISAGDLMSKGGPSPYAKVIKASFGTLADWMATVPSPDREEERDAFDRLDPLGLFFEVSEG